MHRRMYNKMFPAIGGAQYSPDNLLLIRLLRKGCRNRPFFHIAVVEAKRHVSAPIIEQIGSYDPLPNSHNEKLFVVNFKKLEYWLRNGAKPTPPMQKLLGLCGYFPVHYETFQSAWDNRKLIKNHLDNLTAAVAEIERNKKEEVSIGSETVKSEATTSPSQSTHSEETTMQSQNAKEPKNG